MNPPTLLTKKEPALRYLVAHEIGHLVPGYSQNVANNIIEQTRADKFALTLLGPDAFREGYRIYGDPDHKINEEIKNLYAFQPEPMFHAWGIIRESLLDLWEPLGITKPPPVILVKYAGEVPTGIFLLDKTPFVSISFYDLARQIRVSKDPETSARIFAARTATLYKFYLQNEGRTPETEKEKTIFDAEALRACMFVTRTECSEK